MLGMSHSDEGGRGREGREGERGEGRDGRGEGKEVVNRTRS